MLGNYNLYVWYYLYAIDNAEKLAGFVHFRFEYDDDESPSCAVLDIFEIQIEADYRRCGLGKHLMGIAERIGREQSMTKVVLTVFKTNQQAMAFYTKRLQYEIDELSPSKFGDHNADYEILSLKLQWSNGPGGVELEILNCRIIFTLSK